MNSRVRICIIEKQGITPTLHTEKHTIIINEIYFNFHAKMQRTAKLAENNESLLSLFKPYFIHHSEFLILNSQLSSTSSPKPHTPFEFQ